jgi:uncharacterized repeat protein (TIGR03803 family)
MRRSIASAWRKVVATLAVASLPLAAAAVDFTQVRQLDSDLEGAYCNGDLVELAPGEMYLTCSDHGPAHQGTVLRIGTDGKTQVLAEFSRFKSSPYKPLGGLIDGGDGALYGTTASGGDYGHGTVFRIKPGGRLTVLHHFGAIANDGDAPYAGLMKASDGRFYGTTWVGGANSSSGTVFRISKSGKYKVLYDFSDGKDGGHPRAELAEGPDGALYGVAEYGGTYGEGTLFRLTLDGQLTVLHHFGGPLADGAKPRAGLTLAADGKFYGTSSYRDTDQQGTVFRLDPASGDFEVLHVLQGDEGCSPWARLVAGPDGWLYGSTFRCALSSVGTLFRVSPQTGEFELVHRLVYSEGVGPKGGLLLASDGALYGTTWEWPSTLFRLSGF